MELNGKTKVTLSIATIGALLSGAYVFSGDVHDIKNQLAVNSAQIEQINKRGVAQQISDKNTERRNIEAALRNDPTNKYLLRDQAEVADELKALALIQECFNDPLKENCNG